MIVTVFDTVAVNVTEVLKKNGFAGVPNAAPVVSAGTVNEQIFAEQLKLLNVWVTLALSFTVKDDCANAGLKPAANNRAATRIFLIMDFP